MTAAADTVREALRFARADYTDEEWDEVETAMEALEAVAETAEALRQALETIAAHKDHISLPSECLRSAIDTAVSALAAAGSAAQGNSDG